MTKRKRDPDLIDDENPELTDEQIKQARPASEVLPRALFAELTRKRGRPKSEAKKVPITLRVDQETLAAFKREGAGWQTRMNLALQKAASGPTMRKRSA